MTYLQDQKKSGLKVGDTVRVTRRARDFERGWDLAWMSMMDKYVRKTGVIFKEDDRDGFVVSFEKENDGYWYPYFVLEKVTPKRKSKTPSLDKLCKKHGIKPQDLRDLSAVLRDLADWVEGKE